MADRIFPSNTNLELGSEIEFSGINWSDVALKMANHKEVETARKTASNKNVSDFLKLAKAEADQKDAEMEETETADEDNSTTANKKSKKKMPSEFEKFIKNKKNRKDMADDENMDEEEEDMDQLNDVPSKKKNIKKANDTIIFTSPDQINANALKHAEASGNIVLRDTILAARQARRAALANYALSQIKTAQQNKSSVKSSKTIDTLSNIEHKLKDQHNEGNDANTDDFVPAPKLKGASRDIFMRKAQAMGFPLEYVESMMGSADEHASTLITNAREVIASNISNGAKEAVVAAIIKEALEKEDKNRILEYWKNEMGYDIPGFTDLLVEDFTVNSTPKKD